MIDHVIEPPDLVHVMANEPSHAVSTCAPAAFVHVMADRPSRSVSPLLYGIFFEDINHAADGGLYGELVRNRSFEDTLPPDGCTVGSGTMCTPSGWETKFDVSDPVPGWTLQVDAPAKGTIHLDHRVILNSANPRSLRLEADCATGGSVSVANGGYWGIPIDSGAHYRLSFFARTDRASRVSITASLRSIDGEEYASQTIDGITDQWKQHFCTLISSGSDRNARLVITVTDSCVLWLEVVSLFPEATWERRANGLRPDLMQMLAHLKPAFVRFPGGCFVEGITPDTAFQWKNTVGPVHERKGHWNVWGYRTTNGLGFHEYLQMCEDLGAEPMYVFNCGMTCQARKGGALPIEDLDNWIQDALDAVEYANGPIDSKWGALRAAAGHPEPFYLRFLEIGNENHGTDYEERYRRFYDVLKKRYPEMRLITNAPVSGLPMEVLDEHYYADPAFFLSHWMKYDSYHRNGPEVYVGEYAVTQGCGQGNLQAALAEAAFMIGMERNADVVTMSSYAPLFANVHHKTWNPDAICFDNSSCYGTPSYFVQAMFAQNRPDETLSYNFTGPEEHDTLPLHGGIGLSTWYGSAEFRDVRITHGDTVLYASDFVSDSGEWRSVRGDWAVVDGAYRQTSEAPDTLARIIDAGWEDYTLTLKAQKLGGKEGFMVLFRMRCEDSCFRWNIGGWNNALHGIVMKYKGREVMLANPVPGSIESDRWYDIRVEVNGRRVSCFLDDALIHDVEIPSTPLVVAVAGRSRSTEEVVLKVVNASGVPQLTEVNIDGVIGIASQGTEIILSSSNPNDENSLTEPMKVSPVTREVDGLGANFTREFAPHSLTILRLKAE